MFVSVCDLNSCPICVLHQLGTWSPRIAGHATTAAVQVHFMQPRQHVQALCPALSRVSSAYPCLGGGHSAEAAHRDRVTGCIHTVFTTASVLIITASDLRLHAFAASLAVRLGLFKWKPLCRMNLSKICVKPYLQDTPCGGVAARSGGNTSPVSLRSVYEVLRDRWHGDAGRGGWQLEDSEVDYYLPDWKCVAPLKQQRL